MFTNSNALAFCACALFFVTANAEDFVSQPASVASTSEFNDYYAQPDTVRSPSDIRIEEPAEVGTGMGGKDNCGKGGGCGKACGHGCGCTCYLFGPDEPWTLMSVLPENECRRTNVGGWMQFGYHSTVTPLSVDYGDGLSFNDVPGHLNAQQMWLYAERVADGNCGWDWGYRLDVMYGTDAQKTQAFGNPPGIPGGGPRGWDNQLDHGVYGWALPQAYLQVANGDLSVIAGHFFTIVGYEVITAPGNFFYSHAFTMFNSEPFTHTGVLATYTVNDNLEVYAGWTLGWDTGYDQFKNGSNWLGGFKYTFSDRASVTYVSTAGDFGARGKEAYSHSIVFNFNLTDRLDWIVQSDYVSILKDPNGNVPVNLNDQVGLNQYLFYTINDCWKAGVRAEWWHSDGASYNEVTAGINYKPHANVVIRPEYRYNFGNQPITNGVHTKANRISVFGVDAIITY